MTSSAEIILLTGFEDNTKYMFRNVSSICNSSSGMAVLATGSARSGAKVLQINTSGECGRELTLPSRASYTISFAYRSVTEPSSGGYTIWSLGTAGATPLWDILYRKSTDDLCFRANSSTNWRAEVVVRDNSGAILYGPTWFRAPGSTVVTTPLVTSLSTGVWYLVQVRFIQTTATARTLIIGNYDGTPTGGAEWWYDDLYIASGGLPAPANPVFDYGQPSAIVRDQWTLVAGADDVAAVSGDYDGETTYIGETTVPDGAYYKMAASGLTTENVLGVTCWVTSRRGAAVFTAYSTLATIAGCWDYASPCTINDSGGINNGSDVVFGVSGGPPVAGEVLRIDDELFTVVSYSAPNVTVAARPSLGSTAATHADGAPIYRVIDQQNQTTTVNATEAYQSVLRLNEDLDTTETAIDVTGGTGETQDGDIIRIDNERMLVTAGGGTTTLTVTRGYDGSTAATHSALAVIQYNGYFGTYATLGINPISGLGVSAAELDRLLFGSEMFTSGTYRVSSVVLEWATHADAGDDFERPRDSVRII